MEGLLVGRNGQSAPGDRTAAVGATPGIQRASRLNSRFYSRRRRPDGSGLLSVAIDILGE